MGALGDYLNKNVENVEDISIFFFSIVLVSFILGMFYGGYYQYTHAFYYPFYVLAFILLVKVLVDKSRKKKPAKK
ncbi:MAG: hypothetical protein V1911_03790 [Candidatus Micrarchaeota archaeon]